MALHSGIEWTESTWNPVTGCTKVSPGCANCYAERISKRLQAAGNPSYANGFRVTLHERMLETPLSWARPRMIFVNSMGDLFHEDVPFPFIERVFEVMKKAHRHVFQVLTKRSERLAELAPSLEWPDNVWQGVSVENADYVFRIDHLRQVGSAVRFLSLEPLIGPIPEVSLKGIDWVIVGGESGPGARAMKREWVVGLRDQCLAAHIPFFFKQWGGVERKKAGRLLEGRAYSDMPTILKARLALPLQGKLALK